MTRLTLDASDVAAIIALLTRSKILVAESDDSAWAGMDTTEIVASLDATLSSLTAGSKPDVAELELLFAPTGPLQETATDNGWADEYLELSAKCVDVISNWR